MTAPFLRAYALLLVKTCHRRSTFAMGGMAAQIPIKNDPAANEAAMEKVRADKLREVTEGHDGTWVAHPGLVPVAKQIFDAHMKEANQIARKRQDVHVSAADLVRVPTGTITEAGLRANINVGIGYLESWLRGIGCVPLYNLMEDAATAEISRSQVWQWIRHGAALADGRKVDAALCRQLLEEEVAKLKADAVPGAKWDEAAALFREIAEEPRFVDFLTLPAYERID
jgi:malate synthase